MNLTNELRIGNYVGVENQITTCKVVEIKEKTLRVEYLRDDTGLVHRPIIEIERIKPISLTEEILLKFGFEQGGYDFLFWIKKIGEFNVELAGINHLDEEYPEYQFLNFMWNSDNISSIYHVHELQNLTFSLSKEELTF